MPGVCLQPPAPQRTPLRVAMPRSAAHLQGMVAAGREAPSRSSGPAAPAAPRGGCGCLAWAELPRSPSCCLPFAPAIRAPASTLPACANTETHLNKLRRHNKSKGNKGMCLGAGESLEFNYTGEPLATKVRRVPHATSADVQGGHSSAAGLAVPPRSQCLAQHRHSTGPAEPGKQGMCLWRWVLGTGHFWVPGSRCPCGEAASWRHSDSPSTWALAAPCGAASSTQSCRGAARAAHRALPAPRPCPGPASCLEPPSPAEAREEAAALAAPLRRCARFTARPPLFKDSRSRLQLGLQKELCVEAANL